MMEPNERLEDLLVEWETSRQSGHELTLDELCKDAPELRQQLEEKLAVLKEFSWIADPDEMIGDEETNIENSKTLPVTNVSVGEFVQRLSESGVLEDSDLSRVQEFVPRDPQELAQALAERLIDENLITPYQARVILERGDSPLLLDRYVILDSIGAGGMGVVFKALQRSLDRVVALKVLPKGATDSPEKVERFQREMRAAAKLSHPNVVRAYDAHESNGVYFLAMEFVPGQDLARLVDCHGTLPIAEATDIIAQVSAGLASAHASGIVHRDVKPSNVVLADDGVAKVMDLGLARTREQTRQNSADDLTREGLAMGTFTYMSPEQAFDAKHADEKSDIYSLGCTLYFLLHGRPLFERSNSIQTVLAHREHPAPALGEGRTDVPAELEELFQSMVAKDPEQRPTSMLAVCEAIHPGTDFSSLSTSTPKVAKTAMSPPQEVAVANDSTTKVDSNKDRKQEQSPQASALPAWWKMPAICLLAATAGLLFLMFGPNSTGSNSKGNNDEIRAMTVELLNSEEYSLAATSVDSDYWLDYPEEIPTEPFDVHTAFVYASKFANDESDGLQLQRLATFPNLVSIQISPPAEQDESTIQADSLHRLSAVPTVNMLVFTDCNLKSLSGIEQSQKLDTLMFTGCAIDEGFESLSKLPKLSYLELSQTRCKGDFQWLRELTSLEFLDLSNSNATSECLTLLEELRNFQQLHLTGLDLQSNTLHLNRLTNLKALSLDATAIDDAVIDQVMDLKLESLDLSYTKITPSGLRHLASSQVIREHLTELQLAGLNIKSAIGETATLENLTDLNVENTDFDDECLEAISTLPRLLVLYTYGTELSEVAIDRFRRKSPSCEIVRDSSDDEDF